MILARGKGEKRRGAERIVVDALERMHTHTDASPFVRSFVRARARIPKGTLRERKKNRRARQKNTYLSLFFFHSPVPRVDPRSLPRVVIDEVHLPVEVLGDVPPFRKRYLPIPSPWHISMRFKSIQNLVSLSLSLYRRAVGGRISVRARGCTLPRLHTRASMRK